MVLFCIRSFSSRGSHWKYLRFLESVTVHSWLEIDFKFEQVHLIKCKCILRLKYWPFIRWQINICVIDSQAVIIALILKMV